MRNILLATGLLVGCTQSNATTSLADLAKSYGDTRMEVVSLGKVDILLHIAPTADCPTLSEDLVATFDGVPMNVARGGYDTDSSGCYPIAFWAPEPFPTAKLALFERTTSGSSLEIVDPSARWTVGTGRLFTNEFLIDRSSGTIAWQNVSAISTAQTSPATPLTIEGNVIHYAKDTVIDWVTAYAHPAPTLCDGPSACTIDLEGEHDWTFAP